MENKNIAFHLKSEINMNNLDQYFNFNNLLFKQLSIDGEISWVSELDTQVFLENL